MRAIHGTVGPAFVSGLSADETVGQTVGRKAMMCAKYLVGVADFNLQRLGHDEVVRVLIAAGAPLDHVNNLGWTALIESIVLGDGGRRHVACLKALLDAGANPNLPDRQGRTPLALARARGFAQMISALVAAGGR
jgi:ankyrin repeat protein